MAAPKRSQRNRVALLYRAKGAIPVVDQRASVSRPASRLVRPGLSSGVNAARSVRRHSPRRRLFPDRSVGLSQHTAVTRCGGGGCIVLAQLRPTVAPFMFL